jgi:peptidoglycan L-alanyl-D-glutamate endopeptidase CwlK
MRALVGVHPDLVRVVLRAADGPQAFLVTEGLRSPERQAFLLAAGKSRTTRSRHLTGHAVDLAVLLPDGGISWERLAYKYLALSVKAAAAELRIPIEWGGEAFGPSFYDGPHFQLPHREYPAAAVVASPPASGVV